MEAIEYIGSINKNDIGHYIAYCHQTAKRRYLWRSK